MIPEGVVVALERIKTRVLATEVSGRVKLRKEDVSELLKRYSAIATQLEKTLRKNGILNDWYLRYVDRMKELADPLRAQAIFEEDPLRFPDSQYFKTIFLKAPVLTTMPRYHWVDVEQFESALSSIEKLWRSVGQSDMRTMLFTGLLDMQEAEDAKAERIVQLGIHHEELDALLLDERNLRALERATDQEIIRAMREKSVAAELNTTRLEISEKFCELRVDFWKKKAAAGLLTEADLLRADDKQAFKLTIQEQREEIADYQLDLKECRALKSDRDDEVLNLTKQLTDEKKKLKQCDDRVKVSNALCERQKRQLALLKRTQTGRINALESYVALVQLDTESPTGTLVTGSDRVTLNIRLITSMDRWQKVDTDVAILEATLQQEVLTAEENAKTAKKDLHAVQEECENAVRQLQSEREFGREMHIMVLERAAEVDETMLNMKATLIALYSPKTVIQEAIGNLEKIKRMQLAASSKDQKIVQLKQEAKNLENRAAMMEGIVEKNDDLILEVDRLNADLSTAQKKVERMNLVRETVQAEQVIQDFENLKKTLERVVTDLTAQFTSRIEREDPILQVTSIVSVSMPVGAPAVLSIGEIKSFETKLENISQRANRFIASVVEYSKSTAALIGIPNRANETLVQYLAKGKQGLDKLDETITSLGVRLIGEPWRAGILNLSQAVFAIDKNVVAIIEAIAAVEIQVRGEKFPNLPLDRLKTLETMLIEQDPDRTSQEFAQLRTQLRSTIHNVTALFPEFPRSRPVVGNELSDEILEFKKALEELEQRATTYTTAVNQFLSIAKPLLVLSGLGPIIAIQEAATTLAALPQQIMATMGGQTGVLNKGIWDQVVIGWDVAETAHTQTLREVETLKLQAQNFQELQSQSARELQAMRDQLSLVLVTPQRLPAGFVTATINLVAMVWGRREPQVNEENAGEWVVLATAELQQMAGFLWNAAKLADTEFQKNVVIPGFNPAMVKILEWITQSVTFQDNSVDRLMFLLTGEVPRGNSVEDLEQALNKVYHFLYLENATRDDGQGMIFQGLTPYMNMILVKRGHTKLQINSFYPTRVTDTNESLTLLMRDILQKYQEGIAAGALDVVEFLPNIQVLAPPPNLPTLKATPEVPDILMLEAAPIAEARTKKNLGSVIEREDSKGQIICAPIVVRQATRSFTDDDESVLLEFQLLCSE